MSSCQITFALSLPLSTLELRLFVHQACKPSTSVKSQCHNGKMTVRITYERRVNGKCQRRVGVFVRSCLLNRLKYGPLESFVNAKATNHTNIGQRYHRLGPKTAEPESQLHRNEGKFAPIESKRSSNSSYQNKAGGKVTKPVELAKRKKSANSQDEGKKDTVARHTLKSGPVPESDLKDPKKRSWQKSGMLFDLL
ncbi:unnamed protein product [Protopolystoma xenopodis]|uniref:Uncharacterized protein n=1 Tax=Protopolystoma xenopodis TaxID=117903 RepID=A0A448WFR2_9PLAT|nr:unnamed protein product [Protopolystoma xenopodis]